MSDNFSASNGGTAVTIATKEAGGIHTPRNLIVVAGADVSSSNPLPVTVQFPSSQAVSGPLTDTQLRATALPVSGPLTDAQLRATALPVSGPLTDTQLRAATVRVSLANVPLPTGGDETNRSGTATTANQAQTIMVANAGRKYFELQNLSATDFLWFRKDGSPAGVAAIGSVALAPASATSVGGFYSGQATGAVSVASVTAGHPFSAVEA